MNNGIIEINLKHRYGIKNEIYNKKTSFYEAVDLEYGRKVGIKIITYDKPQDKEYLKQEVKCMIKLEEMTEKIPTVYEYYEDDKNHRIILVMQFIEGRTLRNVINEDLNRLNDNFIIQRKIELLYQLCLVMGAIHKGQYNFQHKDLKPENIIVKNSNQPDQAIYVIDFGITGQPIIKGTGSYGYRSPEQTGKYTYVGSDNVDVFTLGLIMFEVLTGKHIELDVELFAGKQDKEWSSIPNLTDYNSIIPVKFNEIAKMCLQLAPDKRYRNGMEVAKAIWCVMNQRGGRR